MTTPREAEAIKSLIRTYRRQHSEYTHWLDDPAYYQIARTEMAWYRQNVLFYCNQLRDYNYECSQASRNASSPSQVTQSPAE